MNNFSILLLINLCLYGFDFKLINSGIELHSESFSSENPFLGGFNKPKIQWLDWNNDSMIDLFILDEDGRLQLLLNIGNSHFEIVESHFQNIICAGWFFFHDFDNDGSYELITRNQEETIYLSYYENIDEEFYVLENFISTDLGELITSESVVSPTFSDIDNDGDYDFFTGHVTGTLSYYENLGIDNNIPVFMHVSNMWQDIQIIGASTSDLRHGASAISFIDLDGDNDLDLSWGDYYQQSLYIVWNQGSAEFPNMDIVNIDQDYPPNNPVETAGQNMPSFADLDEDGDYDLYITVLGGAYGFNLINNFQYFENIGDVLNPVYIQMTNNFLKVYDIHDNATPVTYDIDDDGDLDLFIGNSFETSAFPWNGRIKFLRNHGNNAQPIYVLEDDAFLGNLLGKELAPEFADIDNDGDADLFIGELYGGILFFENTGSASIPHFTDYMMLDGIDVGYNAVPELCDIDADGDLDLFIGSDDGSIYFYQNNGTLETNFFELIDENWQNIQINGKSSPEFIDFDFDGDLDLLLGTENENILAFENDGTLQLPNMIQADFIDFPMIGRSLKPNILSIDSGYFDIYVGTALGGIYYLRSGQCKNGDLNGDFLTDVSDIIILVDIIMGSSWDEYSLCHGDINQDGLLNISDVILIVTFI